MAGVARPYALFLTQRGHGVQKLFGVRGNGLAGGGVLLA
jgi:hypothetical protein